MLYNSHHNPNLSRTWKKIAYQWLLFKTLSLKFWLVEGSITVLFLQSPIQRQAIKKGRVLHGMLLVAWNAWKNAGMGEVFCFTLLQFFFLANNLRSYGFYKGYEVKFSISLHAIIKKNLNLAYFGLPENS